MVWPTFPGQGGLSVRRDLTIRITSHDPPSGAVMANCKQRMYVQQNRLGICRLAIISFVFRQFRASCKVIRIPESTKFLLGEFGILGIELQEYGIPLTIGIKNTSCIDKNRESVTEIRNLWRGTQNLAVV